MIRKVLNVATVTAILAASAGTAFAAVDESTINTQTATLNFGAEQQVSHVITVNSPLSLTSTAGQEFGKGVISTADGNPALIAVRFTPGFSGVDVNSNKMDVVVHGQNNDGNELNIHLKDDTDSTVLKGTDWWVTKTEVASHTYGIVSKGDQTIAPDTYEISYDAGIWTE